MSSWLKHVVIYQLGVLAEKDVGRTEENMYPPWTALSRISPSCRDFQAPHSLAGCSSTHTIPPLSQQREYTLGIYLGFVVTPLVIQGCAFPFRAASKDGAQLWWGSSQVVSSQQRVAIMAQDNKYPSWYATYKYIACPCPIPCCTCLSLSTSSSTIAGPLPPALVLYPSPAPAPWVSWFSPGSCPYTHSCLRAPSIGVVVAFITLSSLLMPHVLL